MDLGGVGVAMMALGAIVLGILLYFGQRQSYRRRREMGMSPTEASEEPGWRRDPAYGGAKPRSSVEQAKYPPTVDSDAPGAGDPMRRPPI